MSVSEQSPSPSEATVPVSRFLELAGVRRPGYGWGTIVLTFILLAAGCAAAAVVVGTGLVFVMQGTPALWKPTVSVLQLAAIAAWIPVVVLIARIVMRMRVGDLVSCASRVRWPVLARALGVSFVGFGVLGAYLVASSGEGLVVTAPVLLAIMVSVFLVPLQALAEELLFRAFGPQAVMGRTGFGVGVHLLVSTASIALFASLHGSQDVSTWLVYAAFGVVFVGLTYLTGGIEAAFALHAANNVMFIVVGLLLGRDLLVVQLNAETDAVVVLQLAVVVVAASVIAWSSRRSAKECD